MKALILAAGRGTRVQPLTHTMPKPMIPIVHKPVMEMLVDQLRIHGFRDILVNTSYLAPQIEHYFRDGHRFGVQMAYSFEGYEKDGNLIDTPLGSAGAIRKIHAHSGFFDETFVVVCGDAIIDLNLEEMLRFHRERKAMVTMALKTLPEKDLHNYGVAVKGRDGRISAFQEKPQACHALSRQANTGIYIFEPEVLDWIPEVGPYDIGSQLFPQLAAAGERIYGIELPFQWLDIGRLEDYHRVVMQSMLGLAPPYDVPGRPIAPNIWVASNVRANFDRINMRGPICIGGSASIGDGCTLVGPVVIGAGAIIEAGTHLEETVVQEHTRVAGGFYQQKVVGVGFCFDASGNVLDARHTDTAWLFQDARTRPTALSDDQRFILKHADSAATA